MNWPTGVEWAILAGGAFGLALLAVHVRLLVVLLRQQADLLRRFGVQAAHPERVSEPSPGVLAASPQVESKGQPETGGATHDATPRVIAGGRPRRLDAVPPGARPAKQTCVEDEVLPDGSIVLYNGCRRQMLTLNQAGSLVWECCDGEHGLEAIVAELREVFPAAPSLEADVRELLGRLMEEGMIAPSVTTPVAPVNNDEAVAKR